MRVSFKSTPGPPSCACISSRCLIGDKHAGQCRLHHNGPSFAHHANNCQAMGPPLCCALIDSSPLTRFMGVRTFLSVTSNWSTVSLTGGPRPWLAGNGQLSSSCLKDNRTPLMNYLRHSDSIPVKTRQPFLINQHLLCKRRCVFSQLLRENYLAWAVKRAHIQLCQGQ